MNFGNNSQDQQKEKRGPLSNLSARKNQMEYESSGKAEFPFKQAGGETSKFNCLSDLKGQTSQMNLKNTAMQIEQTKPTQMYLQIDTLRAALRDAIDENETLRTRVTELEALYAAAEEEVEKRDSCIQELLIQIAKIDSGTSDSASTSQKAQNCHKRTQSQ